MKFSTINISKQQIPFKNGIQFISKYWFRCVLVFFALQIFFNRNVSIQVQMHAVEMEELAGREIVKAAPVKEEVQRKPVALKTTEPAKITRNEFKPLAALSGAKKAVKKEWKASDFSNLSFVLNPGLQSKKSIPQNIVDIKNGKCRKYVERFARVAIGEMDKYGIPASITLAQGLLESNAGDSQLSKQSNNHFGIKCKSKCLGCTCRNYRDDDVYDMFRVFGTAWESYREHSDLLSKGRYKHLKKLGTKDYKNWAHGLKKAGYATDKKYAEKLIMIIEMLDLYQFDA